MAWGQAAFPDLKVEPPEVVPPLACIASTLHPKPHLPEHLRSTSPPVGGLAREVSLGIRGSA
jgi:hypothetical protein